MGIRSVRMRLTLWNVGVVALVLLVFAGTLCFLVHWSLIRSIDAGLDQRLAWERSLQLKMADYGRRQQEENATASPTTSKAGRRTVRESSPRSVKGEPSSNPERAGNERWEASASPERAARTPEERRNRLRASLIEVGIFDTRGRPAHLVSAAHPWDRAALRRSAKGETVRETVTLEGVPVRFLTAPLVQGGEVVKVFQFGRSMEETERMMENLVQILLVLALPALVVVGICGAFLTNRSLRPVRHFSRATTELAASDFSHRLPEEGKDEFAELAASFNRMTERLEEAFRKLEATNRNLEEANQHLHAAYERQRQFTADVSHELRTPLAAVKANTSMALFDDFTPGDFREAMGVIDQAVNHMNRLVEDLLLLARSDNHELRLDRKSLPAGETVRAAIAEIRRKRSGREVLARLPDPGFRVYGDAHHLHRLLVNLLDNALRHTPEDGTVTVLAQEKDGQAVLRVEDTGSGIPAEHLARVFDRFYRVDDARSRNDGGAGLGLAICKSIVEAHGGSIEIDSRPGEGTAVTIRLPGAEFPARDSVPAGITRSV